MWFSNNIITIVITEILNRITYYYYCYGVRSQKIKFNTRIDNSVQVFAHFWTPRQRVCRRNVVLGPRDFLSKEARLKFPRNLGNNYAGTMCNTGRGVPGENRWVECALATPRELFVFARRYPISSIVSINKGLRKSACGLTVIPITWSIGISHWLFAIISTYLRTSQNRDA